ncbi:hypothetical protein BGP77_15045 [Saccharospirillum sp. MSK14-1]|uniref:DUF1415 domain-containing protein n=1 Tax=Saccharospirillum sp. MSK14-1 TaxID=1897632 RepID=UPI000D3A53B0|nr:DUF1415 domain-containing protein [Saccharospirillum sp. MSK14-1]PTY37792.1 hypothetical protein BGP77_15045 [Saccharospirillum sp. MSK14-1]
MNTQDPVIRSVHHWVERLVVGENLCPFAKRELVKNSVRFVHCSAKDEADLLVDLDAELNRLQDNPEIETTLLIHPQALLDFFDFNNFLDQVDALLRYKNLEGVFQIATFHPDYQFAGTELDDAENYTNRSPYPVLHVLREASLENAIERYPDTADIPQRNIERMEAMGVSQLKAILEDCVALPD